MKDDNKIFISESKSPPYKSKEIINITFIKITTTHCDFTKLQLC
jgi:hypothetical protein